MDMNTAELVAEICWAMQLRQVAWNLGESDQIEYVATLGRE